MAEKPAQLAGCDKQKGKLAAGYDADFVVFEPEQRFEVNEAGLHHRLDLNWQERRQMEFLCQPLTIHLRRPLGTVLMIDPVESVTANPALKPLIRTRIDRRR